MKVTKKDIVKTISTKTGITKLETEIIVESFLSLVQNSLVNNDVIELRGFGTFKLDERKAKKARIPLENREIMLPAQKVPVLKFTKDFRKVVAEKYHDQ